MRVTRLKLLQILFVIVAAVALRQVAYADEMPGDGYQGSYCADFSD